MSIITVLILIVNILQLIIQLYKLKKDWQREVRMETRREMALRRRVEYNGMNGNDHNE